MSEDLIAHLDDVFSAFGRIAARRMFGGWGLYRDGLMFGIVADDAVYLKTDEESRARFQQAGCAPFIYEGGERPIAMSYWSVPEEAMDSPAEMLPWARLAYAAALRKSAEKAKRSTAKKRAVSGAARKPADAAARKAARNKPKALSNRQPAVKKAPAGKPAAAKGRRKSRSR